MKMGQKKKGKSPRVSASFGCMTSKEGAHNVSSGEKKKKQQRRNFQMKKKNNPKKFILAHFGLKLFFNGALVIIFKNGPKVK